ncbi:hypothetical protein Tco_1266446 [Tanacetum coccineum]
MAESSSHNPSSPKITPKEEPGKRNSKKELSSSYVEATDGIDHLVFSFFHLHSESASGHNASADSTAKADPGLSAPNDSISAQHGTNEESRAMKF